AGAERLLLEAREHLPLGVGDRGLGAARAPGRARRGAQTPAALQLLLELAVAHLRERLREAEPAHALSPPPPSGPCCGDVRSRSIRCWEYWLSSRNTTPIPEGSLWTRTTSPTPSMVSMSSMMTVNLRFTRVPIG